MTLRTEDGTVEQITCRLLKHLWKDGVSAWQTVPDDTNPSGRIFQFRCYRCGTPVTAGSSDFEAPE